MPLVSQHDKFRPVIRKTISELKSTKIWEEFKRCVEGAEIRKYEDIEKWRICTLEEASRTGLFPIEKRGIGFRDFEIGRCNFFIADGSDGFAYYIRRDGRTPNVYELVLYSDGDARREKVSSELRDALKRGEGSFDQPRQLIEKILGEDTPTFELDVGTIRRAFENLRLFMSENLQKAWTGMAERLENALVERGYLNKEIGTPFEHALIDDPHPNFSEQHVPHCILLKQAGIEPTRVARELEVIRPAFGKYFGLKGNDGRYVQVGLAPLDKNGKALWLPSVVDTEKLKDALKKYPLETALLESRVAGAKLDILLVEMKIDSRR